MKEKMNLPNKLTILRMALVPVMVVFFYLGMGSPNEAFSGLIANQVFLYVSVAVFVFAACTDFLDGYLARKNNEVTDFGKFMDPLADKALVLVALILLVDRSEFILNADLSFMFYVVPVALIVMLIRELVISGVRLVGANKGVVIAADKLGKYKTISQDIAIPLLMISLPFAYVSELLYSIVFYIGMVGLVIATFLSIISCVSYIVKNKEIFKG